ncbi:MAG TPA: DUF2807 domain-containing protein, partial [Ignavibacteriaceae bacterium]|nr:DUF2807 domain-containing protein [Ignavibacteriaceae bacterium]
MFNKFILVLFFFSLTVFAGEVTKKFDFKDFQKVSVGSGMHVDISQSNSYSIEVKAEENDFKYLKVEQDGDEVKFYIDKRNFRSEDEINIKISMPSLTGIGLSGGSIGKFNMDVSLNNFSCDLSGGSILKGSLK